MPRCTSRPTFDHARRATIRIAAPAAGVATATAFAAGHAPHLVAGLLWTDRLFR